MSDQVIVENCSPTLAGLKTGNLFSIACPSEEQGVEWIRDCNRRLACKGLRMLPMRIHRGRMLVYLYRPSHLVRDMQNETAHRLLSANGYPQECGKCVQHLMERLQQNAEFPHEIGLFLGYPPDDVCGFIENKASCAKCVGCWKVYHNEEEARRKFAQFDKCTRIYTSLLEKGASLEKLTVKS